MIPTDEATSRCDVWPYATGNEIHQCPTEPNLLNGSATWRALCIDKKRDEQMN
jgi:hypothetical protein